MRTASDIDRDAAAWIVRRDASNASAAVEEEFQAWLAADVRHRVAYLRLNAAWERTHIVEKLRPLNGPIDRHLLAPTRPHPERRWFTQWLPAVAALVLLSVGIGSWLVLERRGDVYTTGVGHFERVRLADGSTIELNTNTKVRVRMSNERRYIALVRGEAHFKVAHDPRRPFDVEAGGTTVRAVGTAFSIRLHHGRRAEVLVTEGRVAVATPEVRLQQISLKTIPVSLPTISAGQVAMVETGGVDVQPVPNQELTRKLAWTEGKLAFEEEALAQVVAEFNRYNRQQLVVADRQLERLPVGGSFEATDVPSFLAALERVFGVRAREVRPGEVHLMPAEQAPTADAP